MKLIIDFYNSLDTLNLIIFWGIIIVILLLLIFSLIMVNKNKKLKKIVENCNQDEKEIPIKKEELTKESIKEEIEEENFIPINNIFLEEQEKPKEEVLENNYITNSIKKKVEQDVVNDKHIEIQKNDESPKENITIAKPTTIEMPTGPYQRNVLREMSLSQTSPIGINRRIEKEDKNIEIAKDLKDSLNSEKQEEYKVKDNFKKTEIYEKSISKDYYSQNNSLRENYQTISKSSTVYPKTNNNGYENYHHQEILNTISEIPKANEKKSSSEIYLEEVSKKLSEAELPDEIERTEYELEQEENAIISYKELMEKKDSIQTVDEEEAVISIEELMNRKNKQEMQESSKEIKLYNLTEKEKNEDFIKELKQFRNDL